MNTEVSYGGRVFGGKPAKPRTDSLAASSIRHIPHGGASLISDYWALTAAHVVELVKHQHDLACRK